MSLRYFYKKFNSKKEAEIEFLFLKIFEHLGIPNALGIIKSPFVAVLILKKLPGKSLNRYSAFDLESKIDPKWLIKEILKSLFLIHQWGFFHGDISPQNILFCNKQNIVSLIDYGVMADYFFRENTSPIPLKGRMNYLHPDRLYRDDLMPGYDCYSLSCLAWELEFKEPWIHSQWKKDLIKNELKLEEHLKNLKEKIENTIKNPRTPDYIKFGFKESLNNPKKFKSQDWFEAI